MCQPSLVRHIVLKKFHWKHDALTWGRIGECVNLRSLDCSKWWDGLGSDYQDSGERGHGYDIRRNNGQLALASTALRDKTIETLTLGACDRLTERKELFLRDLRCVRRLHFSLRPASRQPVLRLLSCFDKVVSVTIGGYYGPVALPRELGDYRSLSLETIYDSDFLSSLHGCSLREISLRENSNSELVDFLQANPQLRRVRLSVSYRASDNLVSKITEMAATTFSLVWTQAKRKHLSLLPNVDFLVLRHPRDFDAGVMAKWCKLEYLGLELSRCGPHSDWSALRHLPNLHTFVVCACNIEPPLCLSWTKDCVTLREVSVFDHTHVWCSDCAPQSLPSVLFSPTACPTPMTLSYFHEAMQQHATKKAGKEKKKATRR